MTRESVDQSPLNLLAVLPPVPRVLEETQRVPDVLPIRLLCVEIIEVEADVGAAFVLSPWWWV